MCACSVALFLLMTLILVCGKCENEPSFSVVVPMYKAQKTIARALDSVLDQNYENLEILCMDDKSPDSSAKIVSNFALHDKRIKLIAGEVNVGLDTIRNSGMRLARNDWILFLDSDDWYEQGLFNKLSGIIQNNAAINIIEFPFDYAYMEEQEFKYKPGSLDLGESGIRKTENVNLMEVPAPWNKVFSRIFLKKRNLENNEVHAQAESIFTVCCFMLSQKFYYLDFVGYHYFQGSESMTRSSSTRFSSFAVESLYLNPIEKGLGKYGIHSEELSLSITLRLITWWIPWLRCPRDERAYRTARLILLSLPYVDERKSFEIQMNTKIPHNYKLYRKIYNLPDLDSNYVFKRCRKEKNKKKCTEARKKKSTFCIRR